MPPKSAPSNPSTASNPSASLSNIRPDDAVYLFRCLQHIENPAIINVASVGAAIGTNPHNVECKIGGLKKAYGLNMRCTRTKQSESAAVTATPSPRKGRPKGSKTKTKTPEKENADESQDENGAGAEDGETVTVTLQDAKKPRGVRKGNGKGGGAARKGKKALKSVVQKIKAEAVGNGDEGEGEGAEGDDEMEVEEDGE